MFWVRKKTLFGVSLLFDFGKPLVFFRVSILIIGQDCGNLGQQDKIRIWTKYDPTKYNVL